MSPAERRAREAPPSSLVDHLRTLRPLVADWLRPPRLAPGEPWSTTLEDPAVGSVVLRGELREVPDSRRLVVLVHGLGGSPQSYYVRGAAAELAGLGISTLALALRGADRGGDDFYNVALTADLHATLASPRLARHERIAVVGFSMGGYVALHYAAEARDARVEGVAALCTPLSLATAQRHVDAPAGLPYRLHVLRGLKEIYEAVARRRSVPTPAAIVRRVRTIRDWDRLTIVPRYGFTSPEDYYEKLDVTPRLVDLRVATLLVGVRGDPVVPTSTIGPFLPAAERAPRLTLRWVERAGHAALGATPGLGFEPGGGPMREVCAWLDAQGAAPDAARPDARG